MSDKDDLEEWEKQLFRKMDEAAKGAAIFVSIVLLALLGALFYLVQM